MGGSYKFDIVRASTAQDDITGDGTTSTVLLIGEFLKQADTYISEGLHPRIVTEGFEMVKDKALEVLESVKIPLADGDKAEVLKAIAQTSLGTKVHPVMAEQLTPIVVEAVQAIHVPEKPIDCQGQGEIGHPGLRRRLDDHSQDAGCERWIRLAGGDGQAFGGGARWGERWHG